MEVQIRSTTTDTGFIVSCDIPTALSAAAAPAEVKKAATEQMARIQALFEEYFPNKLWKLHLLSECKVIFVKTSKVFYEVQIELPRLKIKVDAFVEALREL